MHPLALLGIPALLALAFVAYIDGFNRGTESLLRATGPFFALSGILFTTIYITLALLVLHAE